MKRLNLLVIGVIMSAGVALAHSDVKNSVVKARMAAMSGISAEMKILGQMAKGETPFDASRARAAARAIAELSATTPDLFEAEETDPKSEAKAAIWASFADFTTKADNLQTVALGLADSIDSADDLGPAMGALGATCSSCHTTYRQKVSH